MQQSHRTGEGSNAVVNKPVETCKSLQHLKLLNYLPAPPQQFLATPAIT